MWTISARTLLHKLHRGASKYSVNGTAKGTWSSKPLRRRTSPFCNPRIHSAYGYIMPCLQLAVPVTISSALASAPLGHFEHRVPYSVQLKIKTSRIVPLKLIFAQVTSEDIFTFCPYHCCFC
jgi:hypothetical protein